MVLEQEIPSYAAWFPEALRNFGEAAFFVVLAAVIISYLVAAFRYGPMPAGDRLYRALVGAANDLIHISPRRVWALARLAIQESIRRRVWVALIAFGVILMFAGWFLDPSTPEPGPLYLSFVLSWTTYLIVLLALFVSTFSIPADIKNKTITTVVTKPVRGAEIVLGRMLGFTLIGTALLAVMGACSYVFVLRSLNHTHLLETADLNETAMRPGALRPGKIGTTQEAQNHSHDVYLRDDGTLETEFKHGHRHQITTETIEGKTKYAVGPPVDLLVARVPIRGSLRFLDRDGSPKEKGINVGKEWEYRGFVDGNTKSAAIWTFENIDENTLFSKDTPPEKRGLPLEMTIRVFRTYKGNIEKGIAGKLFFRNPDNGTTSEPIIFTAREFAVDRKFIKRQLPKAGAGFNDKPIDLFNDLVSNGRLEVVLQCLEPGQLLGAAAPDLYIRADDASFELNFLKGYAGIWMQMVLVMGIGVMFSTFLSGSVAMLATLGCMLVGFFASFVGDLFKGVIEGNRRLMPGGGPVESFVRLITQKSITVEYDRTPGVAVMEWVDKLFLRFLKAGTDVLPDFSAFSNVNFVAGGFNVPGDLLLEQLTRMVVYLLAAFLAGFLFLRMREVAR